MRAHILFTTAVLACTAALAQSPSEPAPASGAAPHTAATPQEGEQPSRHNQRTERIREEDAGSRIDELRIGGQTKNITVQPKVGNMPSYEVKPGNAGRDGQPAGNSDGTNGRRVWNTLKF